MTAFRKPFILFLVTIIIMIFSSCFPGVEMFSYRYDPNGAFWSDQSYVDSMQERSNTRLTEPKTVPLRSGYAFSGWSLDKEGETPVSFPYELTKDTVFYAIWSLIDDVKDREDYYFITLYDISNGVRTPVARYAVRKGQRSFYEINSPLIEFFTPESKDGLEFSSWYRYENFTSPIDEKAYRIDDNLEFFGKYVDPDAGIENAFTFRLIEGKNAWAVIFNAALALGYTDAEIEIPSVHQGSPVIRIDDVSLAGNILSIRIPSTIEEIASDAFAYCGLLKEVIFEDDSNLNAIPEGAFKDCINLRKINLPDSVRSIGNKAFSSCKQLENLKLPSSLEIIGDEAFSGCSSLVSIEIPSNVSTIGESIFTGCTRLTEIKTNIDDGNIPEGWSENWNGSDATVENSSGSLIVSEYDGLSLIYDEKSDSYIISGLLDKSKTRITIPSMIEGRSVTGIASKAFSMCSNLKECSIPYTITSIGSQAFSGCTSLESMRIPDNVLSVGNDIFLDCSSLKYVIVSWKENERPDGWSSAWLGSDNIPVGYEDKRPVLEGNLEAIEFTLNEDGTAYIVSGLNEGYEDITEIIIPSEYKGLPVKEIKNGALWYSKLEAVFIEEGIEIIDDQAFENCIYLEEINIPASVNTLGTKVFLGCESLRSITLPDTITEIPEKLFESCTSLETFSFENITKIGNGAFQKSGLREVCIPESLTYIGEYAFSDCVKLESLILHDSLSFLGNCAFRGCNSLTSVDVPYLNLENRPTSGYDNIFADCINLSRVSFSEKCTVIPEGIFSGCIALESVVIPSHIAKIESHAFEGCSSLETVKLNDGMKTIGGSAFESCVSLINIILPSGVESIGSSCFEGCVSLTEIIIPESVESIGIACFSGCTSLTEINVNVSVIPGEFINGCENITSITLGDKVTTIDYRAFSGTGATEIIIPDSVTKIGYEAFMESKIKKVQLSQNLKSIGYSAFEGLAIEEIVFPDSLEVIGSTAFKDTHLREITISKNIEEIGRSAFANTPISEIVIPENVIEMGSGIFEGCVNLRSITVPWQEGKTRALWDKEWNLGVESAEMIYDDEDEPSWGVFNFIFVDDENGGHYKVSGVTGSFEIENTLEIYIIPSEYKGLPVTELGQWSRESVPDYLTAIYIPSSITDRYFFNYVPHIEKVVFGEGTKEIPEMAFYEASDLKEVVFPESLESTGYHPFSHTPLERVVIPANVNIIPDSFYMCEDLIEVVVAEGDVPLELAGCFVECINLEKINIPDRVTKIGGDTFRGCKNLSFDNLVLSENVESIGTRAFENCTNIKSITLPETIDTVEARAFSGWTSEQEIHVPWQEGEQKIETWSALWDAECDATIVYKMNKSMSS